MTLRFQTLCYFDAVCVRVTLFTKIGNNSPQRNMHTNVVWNYHRQLLLLIINEMMHTGVPICRTGHFWTSQVYLEKKQKRAATFVTSNYMHIYEAKSLFVFLEQLKLESLKKKMRNRSEASAVSVTTIR